jgi:hypothetical protein
MVDPHRGLASWFAEGEANNGGWRTEEPQ